MREEMILASGAPTSADYRIQGARFVTVKLLILWRSVQAGARKVYAMEASNMAEFARTLAAANPGQRYASVRLEP